MADLKNAYQAVGKEAAEQALDILEVKWKSKYPLVAIKNNPDTAHFTLPSEFIFNILQLF